MGWAGRGGARGIAVAVGGASVEEVVGGERAAGLVAMAARSSGERVVGLVAGDVVGVLG